MSTVGADTCGGGREAALNGIAEQRESKETMNESFPNAFRQTSPSFSSPFCTLPEKCFLENFLLAPPCVGIPDAVFPMAYPGDHPTGQFIPNWGMWLLPQLEGYARRSGDKEMIASFKNKVFAFIDYPWSLQSRDKRVTPSLLLRNGPSFAFRVVYRVTGYLSKCLWDLRLLNPRSCPQLSGRSSPALGSRRSRAFQSCVQ